MNQPTASLPTALALDPGFLQELKQERVSDLATVAQATAVILATAMERLSQDEWETLAAGLSTLLRAAAREVETDA